MPMVRKLVHGMTRWPFLAILALALIAFGAIQAARPRAAEAAYTDSRWQQTSSNPECLCDTCGCEAPTWVTPGVSVLSGAYRHHIPLMSEPSMHGSFSIGLLYRSDISGGSQFGNGVIPDFMITVEQNGSQAYVRMPSGLIATYSTTDGGSTWSTSECGFHATLTKDVDTRFKLTMYDGSVYKMDQYGMTDWFEDPNQNRTEVTCNSSYQVTDITTPGGRFITLTPNAQGYVGSIESEAGDVIDLTYSSGNLTGIHYPATADQTSGIDVTLTRDGYGRLTAVSNGAGQTPWTIAYVGATGVVDYATGSTIDFAYTTGRTDVTDANGHVTRYHYSGKNVTKVEQWISGASQFATEYRYNGNELITIVEPRGNRVDLTKNSVGLVTERRQKTTDTSSSSSSDIVESWTYSNNRVATYTDAMGSTTTYGRDSKGNLTSISYPTVYSPTTQANVSKSFTVNSRGQRTQETDEEGKVVEYEYFASGTAKYGLLKKVKVDPNGLNLITEYGYDAAGNVSTVTDPLSKVTTTTWDALRRRTQVTDPLSQRTKYHYDGASRLTSVEVENLDKDLQAVSGNQWLETSYTYNSHDSVLTITEEIDASTTRTTSLDYDGNQNRIRVTKPEGNKEKWTYNSRNLVATHVRGETSAVESTAEFTYDENGNLTVHEDERDNDTTFTYDLFDRRTKTTNALGHYEEVDYNKAGQVTEIRRYDATPNPDLLVQRSTRYFDERGRHWKTSDLFKDPGTTYSDAVTTIERFKTGHVRYVTNPRSKVTEAQYDNAWRVSKTIDAMGNEVQNTYDAASRRTAWAILEKDGSTNITHEYGATYDDLGRMITRTEKDRNNSSNVLTTTLDYDSRGNVVWVVNAKGDPTRFTFDGLSRMTKKEVALAYGSPIETFTSAIETQWAFDKNNRLTSFKDDATNTSAWAYDAKDRPTSMTYPNSTSIAYVYNATDQATQVTDAAGNVIADTFDALGRNTARSVTKATGFVDTASETRTYDAANRLTVAEDDDYRVEFTYGVIGLSSTVYEETQKYTGSTPKTKTVTTTYSGVGSMTSQTYPSSLALAYGYNDIERLSTVSDGTNTIASFSYIGTRPKVATFQNGTTDNRTYGGFREEVTSIHHKTSGGATLVRMDYGYDAVHDRTYERFGASGSAGDAFEYDKARRLTKAWMGSAAPESPSGNTYVQTIAYNLDDDGNRTSVVTTPYGQSAQTTSYSTNNLNQYTSVGGTSQTYDGNGNLTNDGTLKFVYNYKNQICEVKQASNDTLVATYIYDALGRRVEKWVNSGSVTERYVYSGVETVCVYDGSDALKQEFVFDVTGIDAVLMLQQRDVLDYDGDSNTTETTRSFYHRSGLNCVMELSDMNQAEIASYRYGPFGSATITRAGNPQSGDPLAQARMYCAYIYDAESGLYYCRARYHDPDNGRFSQRDPLGALAGPNAYEYGRSSPPNRRDPLGLDSEPEVRRTVAGVGIITYLTITTDAQLIGFEASEWETVDEAHFEDCSFFLQMRTESMTFLMHEHRHVETFQDYQVLWRLMQTFDSTIKSGQFFSDPRLRAVTVAGYLSSTVVAPKIRGQSDRNPDTNRHQRRSPKTGRYSQHPGRATAKGLAPGASIFLDGGFLVESVSHYLFWRAMDDLLFNPRSGVSRDLVNDWDTYWEETHYWTDWRVLVVCDDPAGSGIDRLPCSDAGQSRTPRRPTREVTPRGTSR